MLAQIERGQVKPESLHAPDETLHIAPAGVKALVRLEAGRDQLEIAQELLRTFVAVGPAVVGEAQPLGNLAEEHAIRHAIVAHGRDAERAGNQRGVQLDALAELGIDRASAGALRQQLRQHAALLEVRVDDHLLLARQRLADGLGVYVRIAVHVAADPGAEADHVRQLERIRRHAVELGERLGELVVERRQDAIQDLGEIEHHVFALVGHREPLARMVFGLPRGGELGAHAAPVLPQFLRRQRGIEAVEQQLGDALVLAQHRAACALGGMRGEHRLDADLLQQLEHLVEREAAALELGERGLDSARLRALAGLEEIAAAAADAMHLLGEIDRAEPHGEGARQVARHLRSAPAQLDAELGRGFLVAGAAPDR